MIVIDDILAFFEGLKLTIELRHYIEKLTSKYSLEIQELMDLAENTEIDYGSQVNVTGIYSDFVPISRYLTMDLERVGEFNVDPLPCKPFSINGYYCSALQHYSSEYAGDPNCIPILFKDDTKRSLSSLSGTTVEVKGKLISIPDIWKKFLDVDTPIGIEANSIEIIEDEKDSFGILLWKIINDEKAPLKVGGGQITFSSSIWSCNTRLDSHKILCMNGGNAERRHGNNNEAHENILEFYLANILDEEEYNAVSEYLAVKFHDKKADVQYDMVKDPWGQSDWLKKEIGIG